MNDTLDPARRAAQVTRAAAFAGLHTPASPLALANAWDVAGARLVEAAGGAAVATTSAGVAWSLGAPDGDALARDRALDLVSRVARPCPYPSPRTSRAASAPTPPGWRRPSPGCWPPARSGSTSRTATARPPITRSGWPRPRRRRDGGDPALRQRPRGHVPLRPRGAGRPPRRDPEARRRVPGGRRHGNLRPRRHRSGHRRRARQGHRRPAQRPGRPRRPSVAELGALGVARVSLGSWVAEAAYAVVRRAAEEMLREGTYTSLAGSLPYGELNALLKG